jgi:hypothetical protein
MKRTKKNHLDMLPEYDFRHGIRGKYAKRYARGTNVIVLEPSVAKVFPNSKSVNNALRALLEALRHQWKRA